jgi:N-acetylmuramidase
LGHYGGLFALEGQTMIISGSVGAGGLNKETDVIFVQQRIWVHRDWLGTVPPVEANGNCGFHTIAAIKQFQATAAALAPDKVDGLVSPRGFTIKRLELAIIPKPKHKIFTAPGWTHPAAGQITKAHLEAAALTLGCEVAAIQAVVEVESKIRGPWDELGRPTILYERHKFAHWSNDVFNATHPDIANKKNGGYGLFRAQYPKLYRAATLNEQAALKSASWGTFQIMGENHTTAGHASVEGFVDAMIRNEIAHLDAFVAFVSASSSLKKALKDKAWATFAKGYNGAGYKANSYDTKMKAAYDRLAPKPKPKVKAKPAAARR